MPAPMSKAEREAFLKEPRPAILSIPVADKGPLSSPVWFDFAPDVGLWILMQEDSRKGQLVQVGSRITVCAQQEARPYRYVSVEGPITDIVHYDIDSDLKAMAARYLGEAGSVGFIEGMRAKYAQGHGIKVTMHPEHWLSADYTK